MFFYSIFHGDKKVERKITSLAIPNLNPIKSPTIFMVMLVRNENDIIEKNIVFHKELGVDGIIVTDNGSDDGTRQTLERLKANGLITEVIDDPFAEYRQKELVHRMIMLAKRKYRADFIISVDADEFWFPKTRNFKETLSKFRGSLLYVPIYNMIDEGGYFLDNVKRICKEIPKAKIEDLVQRGCLAKYNQYSSQIPKVIIRASDYCYVANGNHNALVERPHRKIVSDDIKIYHFASRGVRQFERKNIDNGRRLARSSLDPNFGVHWRYFYDQFKCGVPIQSLYNKYIGKDCLLEFDGFCVEDQAVRNVLCLRDLKDGRFPELMSFREMLHKILAGCSMIRYGDAEFDIGFIQENKDDPYQKPSVRLTERLAKILAKNDPKILVCIPPLESEHNNIRNFRNSGFTFWEWYWVSRWERLSKYIDKKIYGNSFFSRDSVFYELSVSEISAIWNGRKVVFVYSREGRFVFDQRLFSGVKERFEVFIPATNAFDDYERILSECLKFPKDVLFFISAGPTACVLVDDLVNAGYQALDMGHFPNCYLQYLGESSAPELLPMDKSKLKKTK